MNEYLPVKKSQIPYFSTIPFYYQSASGEFVLYKKEGAPLDNSRAKENRIPLIYIHENDKDRGLQELTATLNMDLARNIASGGLIKVKEILCHLVEEALTPNQEQIMDALPETIEILLTECGKGHGIMEYLSLIENQSPQLVSHTVNVTALILQYCFFHNLSDAETKQLALSALIHDIGCSEIDKTIIESKAKLKSCQFKTYQNHTKIGYNMIIKNKSLGNVAPKVALEHHERIDGGGYPNGITKISRASQLIGFIDSYEPLTNRDKTFRKAKSPFEALQLMKGEVTQGKFKKKYIYGFYVMSH